VSKNKEIFLRLISCSMGPAMAPASAHAFGQLERLAHQPRHGFHINIPCVDL
jgi:hypothetical protein